MTETPRKKEFHPLADIFPLLEGEAFEELVADIKKNGLRERIDLFKGKIADGRNRYRALLHLGIDPDAEPSTYFRKAIYTHTVGGEIAPHEQSDDDRVRAYIVSKNIHRRHLTPEDKRNAIAALLKANPAQSDRAVAKVAKVDKNTVASERKKLEGRGEIHHVEKRTDSKGRNQPAEKAKRPPLPEEEVGGEPEIETLPKEIRESFLISAGAAVELAAYCGPIDALVIEMAATAWSELHTTLKNNLKLTADYQKENSDIPGSKPIPQIEDKDNATRH